MRERLHGCRVAWNVLSAAELSRVRELQSRGHNLGAIALITGLLGRDIDLALWRGLGR